MTPKNCCLCIGEPCNLYKCNLSLALNIRVPFSSPYQHPRPKTSSTTPRRPTLSPTCILGSHLRHPRPARVSLSNVNDENIFYHLNIISRRLVLPFALAVVLDAARATRAAASMITVAAVPAADVVLFVSFVTCVVVMLWWSVRSEWRWRVRFFFRRTGQLFLFGSCQASFLKDTRAQPCMGLGGPSVGSIGLLCGVL